MSAAQSPLRDLEVELRCVTDLKPYAANARVHGKKQVAQIAASIREFGFNTPILVDGEGVLIAGHGRLEAARSLGMTEVPAITLRHLTSSQRRAFVIADNRLAEQATWSVELLGAELQKLWMDGPEFEIEITGFEGHELDRLLDPDVGKCIPKEDRIPEAGGPAVTRLGDVWIMGAHRLACADARHATSYEALMNCECARMVFADVPYNCRIDGNVGGKGKIARREFIMASGEMTSEEFISFLSEALGCAVAVSVDGAIHHCCIDWRHLSELQAAGAKIYSEQKNLVVWVKTNAGMGTFYRSQHELIAVFKVGTAAHTNTFGLGKTGRHRSNVWTYPGMNSFQAGRDEALGWHSTVKPVALVADAIRDVSRRREIVLDPFGGSGTTLIAAQKTGRRARLLELDPLYCDVICRRWAAFSRDQAVLESDGRRFDEVAEERLAAEVADV